MRRLVFALHRALAADLYWIRAIQYYGGHQAHRSARSRRWLEPPPALAATPADAFELLYPLLDITTTLDPLFNIAYRFGSIFLAEPYPGGAGPARPGDRPARKGFAQELDPISGNTGRISGSCTTGGGTTTARRPRAGSPRPAEVPGAPWWLRSLAATTLAQGGDRRSSRVDVAGDLYATADNDWLQHEAPSGG